MMKRNAILAILLAAATTQWGLAQSAPAKPSKAKAKTAEQMQLEQMDERIQKLEQMVQTLAQQLQQRDKDMATSQKQAEATQAAVQAAAQQQRARGESTLETVTKNSTAITDMQGNLSELKTANAAMKQSLATEQQQTAVVRDTSSLHFMGIDLKPGGYAAAETVLRQRAMGSDINTPFTQMPFAGQTAANFSEFNASSRQSRLTLLAEGKISNGTLRAYYEGDFLSAGTTSNDNESNSYTLRQRQIWAQAALNSGWTITAGQMWSLATEYKSGLTNNTENAPLNIDAQYNVGFTWARQYGFRVVKSMGSKMWLGLAAEGAQTLNIGGHNLPAIVYQQAGNGGGLYNSGANYSYNYAPDLIAKIAFEPGYGHYEIFGVGRFFRARVFPNAVSLNGSTVSSNPTAGAYTSKTQGGGVGLNARFPLFGNKLSAGLHVLAGDGIGRYSASQLPDATEHADGSLELLAGGSALASLEWHATPRLDVYSYYGGEYAKRAYYQTGLTFLNGVNAGQPVLAGYGAPTNNVSGCHIEVAPTTSSNGGGYVPGAAQLCQADNRNVQEATLGYWYRFYKGPKGTLQQGIQYSYGVRHTWLGIGDPLTNQGGSPKAINNMWFTSFRFYFPQ